MRIGFGTYLDQHPGLRPRMKLELAERSISSSAGSMALFLVSYCVTVATHTQDTFTYLSGVLVLFPNLVRFLLGVGAVRGMQRSMDLEDRYFSLLVLLSALGWAVGSSSILYNQGFSHISAQIVFLIISGVAASSLVSLGGAPRLLRAFLSVTLLVPMAFSLHLTWGRMEMVFPLVFALYYGFLIQQSRIYFRNLVLSFQSQQQTEKDRNMLQTVLDTVPGFISCLNREFNYVAMNKNLRDSLGLADNQALKLHVGDLHKHAEWRDLFLGFAHSNQRSITKQMQIKVAGEHRWHLLCLRKSEDDNWIVWISLDIHQEKKLELEAIEQKVKFENASKWSALGEMAGGIAHEINNPLAIIAGKAANLKKLAESQEGITEGMDKFKADLTKIEATAHRIAKIIRGLKTLSRDAGNDPMESAQVPAMVEDAVEICREKFKNHSIELRLDTLSAAGLTVEARPAQIVQVLINLLANAHDAVGPLDEKWVELKVETQDEKLVMSVTDSGKGIPQSILDKLMQPFFTTKEIGRGTGLGLSISRRIIEQHQGRLYYDETSPRTRFIVELPLKQVTGLEKKAA